MRTRRASRSVASARPPSTRPVAVMRSQKRSRGPRNVRPNAANAAPTPSARSFTRSAGEERGDDQPDDQQIAERGMELGGLEVDHGDRSLLPGGAELGRADLPDEQRKREHGEERPRRKQAGDHGRRKREVGADNERDVEP